MIPFLCIYIQKSYFLIIHYSWGSYPTLSRTPFFKLVLQFLAFLEHDQCLNNIYIYMESDDLICVHFVFKCKILINAHILGEQSYRFLNISSLHLIPMTCLLGRHTFFVLVLCAIMKSVEGLVYSLMIFSSIGILISLVSFQSGIFNHVLIWVFDIIWTISFRVTLMCAILFQLVFYPNCISFGS